MKPRLRRSRDDYDDGEEKDRESGEIGKSVGRVGGKSAWCAVGGSCGVL